MSTSATATAPVTRTPVGLWVWALVTLGAGGLSAGILCLLWLAALEDPAGGLLVGVFAMTWWAPTLLMALSGIVLVFLAIAEELLGLLLVALASLVCHIPLAFTILGTPVRDVLF